MSPALLIIIIAIILSAFFSGMETAFVSSSKLRIEIDKQTGSFGSGIIAFFSRKPDRFIVTMLIGNYLAIVVFGLFIKVSLEGAFSGLITNTSLLLPLQVIIASLIILFLAEFLPNAFFRRSPNLLLRIFSIPSALVYILFYPLTIMVLKLSDLLMRLFFGSNPEDKDSKNIFGKVDLDDLISEVNDESQDTDLEEHDIKIFQKALDLSNIKVRACMVPRTEIAALSADSSLDDLKQAFIDTGHSNILIYEESIDKIIGHFRLRDLFNSPDNIHDALHKMTIVPESMAANKLLKLFVEQNRKLALVVDEFGGTSGIVTIEDVLEEIVGDIEDEHDSSELTEKKTGHDEYLFSGRLEVDYINETYGLSLPVSDEYETLAGLVLDRVGEIPKINTALKMGKYIIRVVRVSETRLELISVKLSPGTDNDRS